MAPTKFGLFKVRSRDHQDQPSTENLLQRTASGDYVQTPDSPVPSTSKGFDNSMAFAELTSLIDSDDEDDNRNVTVRRVSDSSTVEEVQTHYQPLKNRPSVDATSTSTLQDDDFDHIQPHHCQPTHEGSDNQDVISYEDQDGASTSCDANSIQFDEASLIQKFDETSIAPSEDRSVYCGTLKKPKKTRSKEEQVLKDLDMWRASNFEVMQNLLSRSGTLDEQIKWEAIATARGLCTLTNNCACGDCGDGAGAEADGDGGLGAAPLWNALSGGCILQ